MTLSLGESLDKFLCAYRLYRLAVVGVDGVVVELTPVPLVTDRGLSTVEEPSYQAGYGALPIQRRYAARIPHRTLQIAAAIAEITPDAALQVGKDWRLRNGPAAPWLYLQVQKEPVRDPAAWHVVFELANPVTEAERP